MHIMIRRGLAVAAVLTLGVGTVGCSSQEDSTADTTDTVTDTDTDFNDVAVDSIVGLEVTAVGNVSDVLSDEAIRLDRDGLGAAEEDTGEVGEPLDYYDYDYYDYDDLTEYDSDFDDEDAADEGVLVVDAGGLQNWAVDESVRVSGTVRRFDQDTIESLYEVDLEDETFAELEDALIIVADSVQPASAPGSMGSDAMGSEASASPSASPSAAG